MPLYSYICDSCLTVVEINHSIDEKYKELCKSCNAIEDLRKIPSSFSIMKNKEYLKDEFLKTHKPGEIIEQTISETREDIQKDREELSKRLYQPKKQ